MVGKMKIKANVPFYYPEGQTDETEFIDPSIINLKNTTIESKIIISQYELAIQKK